LPSDKPWVQRVPDEEQAKRFNAAAPTRVVHHEKWSRHTEGASDFLNLMIARLDLLAVLGRLREGFRLHALFTDQPLVPLLRARLLILQAPVDVLKLFVAKFSVVRTRPANLRSVLEQTRRGLLCLHRAARRTLGLFDARH